MLIDDIKEFKSDFESLVYCKVVDNTISICDEICLDVIPFGIVKESYYIDKKYTDVNLLDYIIQIDYYVYYKPITYNLFNRYFNLNEEVQKVLKNNQVNIYEIELIMGGALQNNGGYRDITTNDCYKMKRINTYKVEIETPPNLLKQNIIITTNSYFPNCLYILE